MPKKRKNPSVREIAPISYHRRGFFPFVERKLPGLFGGLKVSFEEFASCFPLVPDVALPVDFIALLLQRFGDDSVALTVLSLVLTFRLLLSRILTSDDCNRFVSS